jgi:hypothetical protein
MAALPANLLVLIDISDASNVLFTATGATPTRNDTSFSGSDGISFLNFMTGDEDVFATVAPGRTFSAAGPPPFPIFQINDATGVGSPPGRDFVFLNPNNNDGSITFDTSAPAFTGTSSVNLSFYASSLPTVGTTGDIRPGAGVGFFNVDPIGTYQVVPEPAQAGLLLASIAFVVAWSQIGRRKYSERSK